MRLYYVTCNTSEEAKKISRDLLEKRLAVCINWFPISCAYRWKGAIEITEEPEMVMIIKTQDGYLSDIEEVVSAHISYTNFMAEISPTNVNQPFIDWLNAEIPIRS